MESEQITKDDLAHWKAVCEYPRTIAFEQEARTALPALLTAYERAVGELQVTEESRAKCITAVVELQDEVEILKADRDRLTARVTEVEGERLDLYVAARTLAEERDALYRELDRARRR